MIESVSNSLPAAAQSAANQSADVRSQRVLEAAREQRDAVELSSAARQRLEQTPIRRDLVERVREEIEAGTYLTEDKIDAVVDRLLSKLIQAA